MALMTLSTSSSSRRFILRESAFSSVTELFSCRGVTLCEAELERSFSKFEELDEEKLIVAVVKARLPQRTLQMAGMPNLTSVLQVFFFFSFF